MSSRSRRLTGLVSIAALALASCGGGGGGGGGGGPVVPPPSPGFVYSVPGPESLSVADVQKVIAQAVAEATAQGRPSIIAVTDRVGNVLGVYAMAGAPATATVRAGPGGNLDLQGAVVPSAAAAISKAITGAYLSSGGNAFSTRTASMIVQEHFPRSPATVGLESGPLFGVQFSQLPCSDLSRRFGVDAFTGPKNSPLGLAADAGGFPLYKNGVLVGGVGIMGDGDYGFDPNVLDVDDEDEEAIALAGTASFDAPTEIRAERITVDGTTLRYSDSPGLITNPAAAPAFGTLGVGVGAVVPVAGFFAGVIIAGQTYGSEASGVRPVTPAEFSKPDAYVVSNGVGVNRYPPSAGTDAAEVGTPLTAAETRALLEEAFTVMSRARAQIRRPLDSRAQVSISVVDTRGAILGIVRSPDAPMFGIDVSLQKARSASFLSGPFAAADLLGDPSADVRSFVPAMRTFLANPTALTGATAFAERSIGNMARPYYPDGQVGNPPGPLSRPIAQWSIFSTGLQTALIRSNLFGGPATRCTFLPDVAPGQNRLQNGLQIFPGAVPIYRGSVLIGGIGVSGDGIDQDDMVSFLGLHNAAVRLGSIQQAPVGIRADQLTPQGVRLRYVNCPFAPFVDSTEQNVCQGK